MTDERLAELEALANAATPGPWFPRWGGEPGYVYSHSAERVIAEVADDRNDDRPRDDSKFIAAARSALPELLAEVRRLRNDAVLARAVRGIENALIFDGLELNAWTSAAGFSASLVPEQHTQPKPQAIVKRQGDLTTALIALEKQVTNANH